MESTVELICLSCIKMYDSTDNGTCKKCYQKACKIEEELKAKVAFLRLSSPLDSHNRSSAVSGYTDIVLVASDEHDSNPVPIPAHKAVLAARSPVFKAMLELEMEETISGTIKITDVSYDSLRAFINYFYSAETTSLDEKMAQDLLVLAEKYQVKHLKANCEEFLITKLSWDNVLTSLSFAQLHNAKNLSSSSLSMLTDNMEMLIKTEGYSLLVQRDAKLVVEIFEAYFSTKVNTAAKV